MTLGRDAASHERNVSMPDVVVPDPASISTVSNLVAWAISSSVARLVSHDPVVRRERDPEGVHQARVATRRLRSDLRTFRSVLVRERSEALRAELRWLGEELGAVRDLDVMGERLRRDGEQLPDEDPASVATVLNRLAAARDDARSSLLSAMGTPRYLALVDDLVEMASTPPVPAGAADRPAATLTAVMRTPWARLTRVCDGLGPSATDADLHRARIAAKRVRYAAEALVPAVGKPARRCARRAEALQDALGAHQDAVMTIAWLRDQTAGTTPPVAFVSGRLAELESAAREEARRAWPAAWAATNDARLPFW